MAATIHLFDLLNKISPLEDKESDQIRQSFKPLKLHKGDHFLQTGEINKYVGFLNKGLVRYYVFKENEESTFIFSKEGEFIADYQSFNNKTPSLQNIQAIEDCEFLVIDYEHVQEVFHTTPHGNLIGRLIIEQRFDSMVNQLLAIYMQNHEDRYRHFVKHYADLTQRIPQYLIASYVGVKPESLSRIRRRMVKDLS